MSFIQRMRALFKMSKRASAEDLLKHVSLQLQTFADELQSSIESAAATSDATIEYVLQDRSGAELQTEWQDNDYITRDEIESTAGFESLQQRARQLGAKMQFNDESIEEVDDEERLRFVVIISGWGSV